jgi:hypothetical protein
MALLQPTVVELTAATTDMAGMMAALRAYFEGTPDHFSVVANTPGDDGFTLSPSAAGETWQLNLRRVGDVVYFAIDPLAGFSSPGDAATAPVVSDASEWSTEIVVIDMASIHATFYLVELPDAIFVIPFDPTGTHTTNVGHAGRVMLPHYYDDNGQEGGIDGLGILGGFPVASVGNFTTSWLSNNGGSVIRVDTKQGASPGDQWVGAGASYTPTGALAGRIQGVERFARITVEAQNADGSDDVNVGKMKYVLFSRLQRAAGKWWDGGAGNDAWMHVVYSGAANYLVVPWDRDVGSPLV